MAVLGKNTVSDDETKYAEFTKTIEKIFEFLKTKIGNKVDLEAVLLSF